MPMSVAHAKSSLIDNLEVVVMKDSTYRTVVEPAIKSTSQAYPLSRRTRPKRPDVEVVRSQVARLSAVLRLAQEPCGHLAECPARKVEPLPGLRGLLHKGGFVSLPDFIGGPQNHSHGPHT